ncbi:MAG: electron transfer flavoprotein subunit beta/FixA family protein [Bradymonadaceae bacterium]
MKIMSTVKRVTDPDQKISISDDGTAVETEGGEEVMNQMDEWGVEEAIQLKEEHADADDEDWEVVVVSVGSSDATKEIRKGIAMGADRGILVETDEDPDSDAVARILAEVARDEEPDLITLGKLSLDTDRNQTGQLLAAYLGWPQATFAYEVELGDDGWVTVDREIDGGSDTKRLRLPAIITAIERLNDPRYAALPDIMQAKNKPLDVTTPDELGVDIAPKLKAERFEFPPEREAGEIVEDVDELIEKLEDEANLI